MTLHWWMHWFWITRLAAVITQLLFIVTAVQTVPLTASTLHPQVQGSHNSRNPVTNWASENDHVFISHQPTSVYVEHHRQTVVYESNPVWSSSPDIEEPFYPTTASSDHRNSKQATQSIPVTFKSISKHEFYTETYPVSHVGKNEYDNSKPTEFSVQNHIQQTNVEEPLLHTPNSTEQDGDVHFNVHVEEIQSLGNTEKLDPDIWKLEEPHALPLEVISPIATLRNEDVTKQSSLINPPNILDDNNKYNKDVYISKAQNLVNTSNDSKVSFLNSNTSILSENNIVQSRRHKQRLVARDLSNISEHVFPLFASSHGDNSSNLGNESLHQNIRIGKAIGHFPHTSTPESLNSKSEPIPSNEKIDSNNRSSQYPIEKLNRRDEKSNVKENNNDTKNVANHDIIENIHHTTTLPDVKSLSGHLPDVADSVLEGSKTFALESGSSRFTPDRSNKTNNSPSSNSTSSNISATNWDEPKIASTNHTFLKSKMVNNTQDNPIRSKSQEEGNSTLLNKPGKIRSSDTDEAGSLNPVHVHENIGRSASFSTGEGVTITPTIVPVSRSRIAASPNDNPHKGLDAASITGIALGIVVFAGLTGAVSFILYRRRYLNKPQTLNDKCSNPDSSGYIDDSTLRENSEEMYSLDNDSFLNSLEAMTIQNYWTDNETCWRQTHP